MLSLPRAHVRSLVRELRSYKLINHCGHKNRDSQVILAARLLHLEITPPDRSALALSSLVLESPAQRTLPQGALEHQDGPASPHPVCFQNSTFLLLKLSDGLMCLCVNRADAPHDPGLCLPDVPHAKHRTQHGAQAQ